MEFSQILGTIAAFVLLVGYTLYYRATSSKNAKPNAASWSLWVILIALNAVSYGIMTGDSVKAYLSFASSLAAIAIFLNALIRGEFKAWNEWDVTCFFIGVIACMAWWISRSATYSNLIFQLALGIGAIPTFISAWEDPKREPLLPWVIWTIAFLLLIITVGMRWENQWQDIVYPINGILMHAIVSWIIIYRSRKKLEAIFT